MTFSDDKFPASPARFLLPLLVLTGALAAWFALSATIYRHREYLFPSPGGVLASFLTEARSGRLLSDCIASLFRVAAGFTLAATLAVPVGLWLGHKIQARFALLPAVNFFRALSPLAWIPYAITWFGIGDAPAIFLIFLSAFFPLILSTLSAVSSIPSVHFRVARDYGLRGAELLTRVTFPAILPQLIVALRVTAGLAWVVVVAAEMAGVEGGLGYGIYEARNGADMNTVTLYMIVIGILGIGIDRILAQATKLPSVRWGYDR